VIRLAQFCEESPESSNWSWEFISQSFSVTLQPRLHAQRASTTKPMSAVLCATNKAALALVDDAAALSTAAALTLAAMKNTLCRLHVLWKVTKP